MKLLNIDEARDFVEAKFGLPITVTQMTRAAQDRRLPFFKEPITGRLRIDRGELEMVYQKKRNAALRGSKR
jgi:hypothetical protein